jgi:NAD(P)-dependent dehydrogenase (short-subunit alcohol dehydrogenase family)
VNSLGKESRYQEKTLTGKTALVTGASRGIGRAIAMALASRGANLVISAHKEMPLRLVKEEIENWGVTCSAVSCDFGDDEHFESTFAQHFSSPGSIDILVNNAGIFRSARTHEATDQDWEEILNINLRAVMKLSNLGLKAMVARGWGRVVNISSISGNMGEAFAAAYAVSKSALNGLTTSLARDVAKFGVTVNAICPGWVYTDMAQQQLLDEKWCELTGIRQSDSIESARLSSLQERFIEPWEIGETVLFLCSDGARSVTGQCISVCGGLSLV